MTESKVTMERSSDISNDNPCKTVCSRRSKRAVVPNSRFKDMNMEFCCKRSRKGKIKGTPFIHEVLDDNSHKAYHDRQAVLSAVYCDLTQTSSHRMDFGSHSCPVDASSYSVEPKNFLTDRNTITMNGLGVNMHTREGVISRTACLSSPAGKCAVLISQLLSRSDATSNSSCLGNTIMKMTQPVTIIPGSNNKHVPASTSIGVSLEENQGTVVSMVNDAAKTVSTGSCVISCSTEMWEKSTTISTSDVVGLVTRSGVCPNSSTGPRSIDVISKLHTACITSPTVKRNVLDVHNTDAYLSGGVESGASVEVTMPQQDTSHRLCPGHSVHLKLYVPQYCNLIPKVKHAVEYNVDDGIASNYMNNEQYLTNTWPVEFSLTSLNGDDNDTHSVDGLVSRKSQLEHSNIENVAVTLESGVNPHDEANVRPASPHLLNRASHWDTGKGINSSTEGVHDSEQNGCPQDRSTGHAFGEIEIGAVDTDLGYSGTDRVTGNVRLPDRDDVLYRRSMRSQNAIVAVSDGKMGSMCVTMDGKDERGDVCLSDKWFLTETVQSQQAVIRQGMSVLVQSSVLCQPSVVLSSCQGLSVGDNDGIHPILSGGDNDHIHPILPEKLSGGENDSIHPILSGGENDSIHPILPERLSGGDNDSIHPILSGGDNDRIHPILPEKLSGGDNDSIHPILSGGDNDRIHPILPEKLSGGDNDSIHPILHEKLSGGDNDSIHPLLHEKLSGGDNDSMHPILSGGDNDRIHPILPEKLSCGDNDSMHPILSGGDNDRIHPILPEKLSGGDNDSMHPILSGGDNDRIHPILPEKLSCGDNDSMHPILSGGDNDRIHPILPEKLSGGDNDSIHPILHEKLSCGDNDSIHPILSGGDNDRIHPILPEKLSGGDNDSIHRILSGGDNDRIHPILPERLSGGDNDNIHPILPERLSGGDNDSIHPILPERLSGGDNDNIHPILPERLSGGENDSMLPILPEQCDAGKDDDVILDSPSNIYASPMHKGEDDDDVFSDGQSNIGTQTPYTKQPNRNILAVQLHPLEDEASDMVTVSHMGIEDGHVGDETVDIGRKEEVVIVEPPPGATIKQNTYFRAQRLDTDPNFYTIDGYGNFTCQVCPYKTKRRSSFYMHKKKHLVTDLRPFACDICSYRAATSSNLKRHQEIHGDVRNHICHVCHLSFRQKIHLERHIKYRHEEKKVRCSLCDYVCANENPDLKVHMKRRHSHQVGVLGSAVAHYCPECNKDIGSKRDLKQHLKFHSKGPELKLFCNMCCFVTDCESRLRRHQYVHSKEKPFKCAQCEYRGAQKEHVLRHMHTRHGQPIIRRFRQKKIPPEEERKVYPEQADYTSKDKIFACNYCVMTFSKLINLYKHLHAQHQDLMPCQPGQFLCVVCDFCTTNKKNLLVHMRRHNVNNQRPPSHVYMCVLCSYTNPKHRNLFQHVRKKHHVQVSGAISDVDTSRLIVLPSNSVSQPVLTDVVQCCQLDASGGRPLSAISGSGSQPLSAISLSQLGDVGERCVERDAVNTSCVHNVAISHVDATLSNVEQPVTFVTKPASMGCIGDGILAEGAIGDAAQEGIQALSSTLAASQEVTEHVQQVKLDDQMSFAIHPATALDYQKFSGHQGGPLEPVEVFELDDGSIVLSGGDGKPDSVTVTSSDWSELHLSSEQVMNLSTGDYLQVNGEMYKVEVTNQNSMNGSHCGRTTNFHIRMHTSSAV